jgi:hypothetical protein
MATSFPSLSVICADRSEAVHRLVALGLKAKGK